jgi:Flp pilus assembly protein TadB
MNLEIIVAIMGSTIAIVGVVVAMMFWVRQEANALRAEAKEDRKDFIQISRNLENYVYAIQSEMKDFHNRLCIIEERSRGLKSEETKKK